MAPGDLSLDERMFVLSVQKLLGTAAPVSLDIDLESNFDRIIEQSIGDDALRAQVLLGGARCVSRVLVQASSCGPDQVGCVFGSAPRRGTCRGVARYGSRGFGSRIRNRLVFRLGFGGVHVVAETF
jgi:hypothetical protein